MPKQIEKMTRTQIEKEIKQIQKQIAEGQVGTPNVYVRLGDLHRALNLDCPR